MDGVGELVVAATALMTTGAVGALVGPVGKSVWDRVMDLKDLVRERFAGDQPVRAAMASLESEAGPSDAEVQILATSLDRVAREDEDFLYGLRSRVSAIREEAGPSFATLVRGDAQVGKIVNIGQARDVSF
jgi:hypothetical protein